nr:hypothetical protein [uncultured Flavobacterium sp.]
MIQKRKNLIIIVVFHLFLSTLSYSQLIDKKLEIYKDSIINFLTEKNEIIDGENKYVISLYSRQIIKLSKNGDTFYQVGMIASHCSMYLAVLKNKKLLFFPTKNFDNEFKDILKYFKNTNLNTSKIISSLDDIKGMYDYNKTIISQVPTLR